MQIKRLKLDSTHQRRLPSKQLRKSFCQTLLTFSLLTSHFSLLLIRFQNLSLSHKMTGGGRDAPPAAAAENSGGEFLLSLLQRPKHQPQPQQQQQQPQFSGQFGSFSSPPPPPRQQHHLQNHQSSLPLDPAVAAVGPSLSFSPPFWQSSGRDLLSPPWPHNLSSTPPPPLAHGFLPWNSLPPVAGGTQFQGNQGEVQRLGFSNPINDVFSQQLEQKKLQFGSFRSNVQSPDSSLLHVNSNNLNTATVVAKERRSFNGVERNRQFDPGMNPNLRNFDRRGRGGGGSGKQHHGENQRPPPPGFLNKPRGGGGGNWDYASRRRELEHNVNKEGNLRLGQEEERLRSGDGLALTRQLDNPGPHAGGNLHSVSALDVEEALFQSDADVVEDGTEDRHELDDFGEEIVDSLLLEDESDSKRLEGETHSKREKKKNRYSREESRSDNRGQRIMSQRMRMLKWQMECRRDIDRLNAPFLSIYESLIPPEEEKVKQKQLLTLLEKLVNQEWPEARLYLYGSCANSFGVLKSDIDVCLAIADVDVNKSEVLLKLADILQSDNLENVQALTRARVPIVKLNDPVTGLSCDICINNVLAVVNTKLLCDYAQIDVRLRQLAFIVKHWAKSRGVNETYQGTLSSYAYVLMCIHFLQQRRPAILPCLQEMERTYSVTIDDIECAYFDQVGKLQGYGSHNKETIAQLVWAFFNYWAYRHDYANDVISVRRGSLISKREKDWTRRIGNDRHLICIEDPFEISHDLGRVVDKFSIRVLKEEFERAADIMQYDPNPCVTLFEPYIPSS